MKKKTSIAALLLAALAAFPMSASAEALDPKEPVTLDLRNADLKDVITTLGAMANLAVIIEPGIEGKVSIHMEKVPYEKILALLAKDNGISIRIEDGKLIASKAQGAAATAPAMPEKFRNAPRLLVADYASAAASPPPLLVQTAWNGEETCSIIRIGARGGGVAEIPISKASGSESLLVADLGYDPVLRSRAIALETTAGSVQREVSLEAGTPTSLHTMRDGTKLRIIVSQEPKLIAKIKERTECGERTFEPARGGAPVTITLLASAVSEGGSSPVFSPRIQTPAGTIFRALGGEAESTDGAQRGYVWSGYVSRDGKSVAFQFKVRAVWTDPQDGRQYYVVQAASPMEGSTSSRFFELKKDGFVLASAISPGAASPRTLELRVSGGQ